MWQGFDGNIGMVGDGLKATPCRKGDIEPLSCHKNGKPMPMVLMAVVYELSPVMMRFCTVFMAKMAHIWHGILTEWKSYRIISTVIVRFYKLGLITIIMGHVSI